MTCEAGLGFCLRLFIVLSGCGNYDLVAVVVHGRAFGCWGHVCVFWIRTTLLGSGARLGPQECGCSYLTSWATMGPMGWHNMQSR